jgi:hypothetical protein
LRFAASGDAAGIGRCASGQVVANVINLAILLAAVAAVGRTKRSLVIATLIGLPVIGFKIASLVQADSSYLIWSWAFGWPLLLTQRCALRAFPGDELGQTLRRGGSLLMIGIMWAYGRDHQCSIPVRSLQQGRR